MGLPVLRALSLCTCCCHYPGAAAGCRFALSSSRISLPRYGCRVGLHIDLFEVCSVFTRVAACTLTLSPFATRFPKASTISSPPWLLRLLPAGAFRRRISPLGSAALSRRTPTSGQKGSPSSRGSFAPAKGAPAGPRQHRTAQNAGKPLRSRGRGALSKRFSIIIRNRMRLKFRPWR